MYKKTIEQHVQDLTAKHGDRYEYPTHRWSKDLASTDVIEIICKVHGSFFMKLSDHKRGYNCPQCARAEGYNKRRATSLKKFEELLPNHITLDCYDWESKEALLICSKHGPIIKKVRKFADTNNLCRHCLLEARKNKVAFLKEYGIPNIIVAVKTYLSSYCIKDFMNTIVKATHIQDYSFTHNNTKQEIKLTLNDIKKICNDKTLF